jgi:hypothetical protein
MKLYMLESHNPVDNPSMVVYTEDIDQFMLEYGLKSKYTFYEVTQSSYIRLFSFDYHLV